MYEIQELKHLSSNENGRTYEFGAIVSAGYLLAMRKQGSISGNHWHKGVSAAKNPESLLLISGSISLVFKHMETGEEEEIKTEGPKLIKIMPNVLHTLKAETDLIFLEFNSLKEHKSDTYYPIND
jgi:dTDP-4-dehydrorhamnose 3,5-epimerase-like enzyme